MELVIQAAEGDVTGFLVALGGLGGHAQGVVLEPHRTFGAVGLAGMIETQGVGGEPLAAAAHFDVALEHRQIACADIQIIRDDVGGLACGIGRIFGQRLEKRQIIGIAAQLPWGAAGVLILGLRIHHGEQAQTGKE